MTHPGDDFDDYINGEWRRNTTIPDDQTRWGSFMILRDDNLMRLKEICDNTGLDEGVIGELYRTLMRPVTTRSKVVQELVDRAQAVQNHHEYLALAGELFTYGITTLLHVCKSADDKDPDTYIPRMYQGSLGLPDKSYYTEREDVHADYLRYVAHACLHYGVQVEAADTMALLEFEKQIAKQHLTRTELRDNERTYNKIPYSYVRAVLPEFFDALALPEMHDVIVSNTRLLPFLQQYIPTVTVSTLRTHLTFRIIKHFAEVGTEDMVQANFEFYGKKLGGQQVLQVKWKRVLNLMNRYLGDELGKKYVEKYFPADKQKMCAKMVATLKTVLAEIIDEQSWMSEETRAEAQRKLQRLRTDKVGAPNKYHSIEGLWTAGVPVDPVVALMEWGKWDWMHEECSKFYGPVDRELWGMTPHTVNAYYSPVMSEIVFPAGILQPPFFGDTMVECLGAIGVIIGHEMTHAFDDEGRKYNSKGELKNWWTPEDAEEFSARAEMVEKHYGRQVICGERVNGKLTLGENIADIGGLRIALRALRKYHSTPNKELYQQFFRAYAKIWGFIVREETAKKMLKIDPHAPPSCRINAALSHISEFYEAYGVQPHHKLYLSPKERMRIW